VLLLEFVRSRSLPAGIGNALLLLAALLVVLLIVYGLRSLFRTAKELSVRSAIAGQPPLPFPVFEGLNLSSEQADKLNSPLPTWSVL